MQPIGIGEWFDSLFPEHSLTFNRALGAKTPHLYFNPKLMFVTITFSYTI